MAVNNSLNIKTEGLQVFDPSDGSFTPIDLTTKGDLLAYDTAYTRLGVGSNNQVLTADSAEATGLKWATNAAAAGAWRFISSATASSDATIDFTSGIDSTYDQYMFTLTSVAPDTDLTELWIRYSSDGGSTWISSANYEYSFNYTNTVGTGSGGRVDESSATAFELTAASGSWGNGTSENGCGTFYIQDPSVAGYIKMFGQFVWTNQDASTSEISIGGHKNSSSIVDGVRFLFSSGNIASGTFALYGLSKS